MSQESSQKLRLGALTALVVGSMIGGGIFSLPQNMAASADVGAVLIGWAITAVGMLTLAFVFQTLANRKPELDGGVYAYAKAGFGDYMGFSSAWGYWISAWLGNVGYFVLLLAPSATSSRSSARATPSPRSSAPRSCSGPCISWCCAGSRRRRSSTPSPPWPRSSRCSCSS